MALLRFRREVLPLAGVVLTAVVLAVPEPAAAQFGFFGGIFRPAYHSNSGYYGRHSYYRRGRSHSDPDGANESASQDRSSDRLLASLAPSTRSQTAIFKSIAPGAVLGTVGSTDDLMQPGTSGTAEAKGEEAQRDYIRRIGDLIKQFKTQMARQRSTSEGDITEYAIQQAVDDAYRHANLQRFETFVGENWSAERLRVMIIDRVDAEIDRLFSGTNKGVVAMSDLRPMIQKSADIVYSRLFETSELLAANRSSALFVQRLYQAHGDLMQGDVREGAERMLMQASVTVTANFVGLVRRDDNSYALGYRQQRILFDCLSENVERISSSEQGIAAPEEIATRIADIEKKECIGWIDQQFKGTDGKLKPQEPVPQRVVWTAEGPKDDLSMYGHPTGAK